MLATSNQVHELMTEKILIFGPNENVKDFLNKIQRLKLNCSVQFGEEGETVFFLND